MSEFAMLAGKGAADAHDAYFLRRMDAIVHPENYWRPSVTYRGIAAKRRLMLKVQSLV